MRKFFLLLLLTSCARHGYERPTVHQAPMLIVLDAGHGDHDPGAKADRVEEKDLTLQTTLMACTYLRRLGYRVALTRTDDTFVPLTTRSAIANEAEATIFVSIHYNASENAEARGVEIFVYRASDKTPRIQASEHLAEAILAKVIRYTGAPSRGVKEANFSVLRRTQMPAVLIEGGFVTNAQDLQHLKDSKYLKAVAWGIAQGIHQYLHGDRPRRDSNARPTA